MTDNILLTPLREFARFIVWWVMTMPSRLWKIGWGFLLTAEDNLRLFSKIRLWFALEPLFGDYGWKGRLIGFIFRGMRIIVTAALYLGLLGLAISLLIAWYLLPILSFRSFF